MAVFFCSPVKPISDGTTKREEADYQVIGASGLFQASLT